MGTATIACLTVTLDDVEPAVLRRIEVPCAITLDDLHLVLQAAFGWTNSHLYEFRASKTARWGIPDDDWPDGPEHAQAANLADVLAGAGEKSLAYLYDFGDGWSHKVTLERVIDAQARVAYPRLVEAKGRCPPEDVGGPYGYAAFLDAIADPKHPRHRELLVWASGAFEPAVVDLAEIKRELTSLRAYFARQRRRKASPAVAT